MAITIFKNPLLVKATALGVALVNYVYSNTGQRTNMVDASGTYSYVFDNCDRLRTNSTPQGTLLYAHDANGNVTSLSSATVNGVSLAYGYDALNRLTNALDSRLSGTSSSSTVYRFDGIGNLQALVYPNGITHLYQIYSLNRLTNLVWNINSTTLASFAYQLGLAGNRTKLSETVNGSNRTNSWGYDALYRLTNETVAGASPTGALGYGYDQVANRTNRSGTLGSLTATNYIYGSNDWLTTDAYDSEGNTRTNGANVYLYDWANRRTNCVNGTTNIVGVKPYSFLILA